MLGIFNGIKVIALPCWELLKLEIEYRCSLGGEGGQPENKEIPQRQDKATAQDT